MDLDVLDGEMNMTTKTKKPKKSATKKTNKKTAAGTQVGLGTLLAEAGVEAEAGSTVLLLVKHIEESEHNARRTYNRWRLEELAASIRAQGLHQPILVRPKTRPEGQPGKPYEIIAGHRRFRAHKLLKLQAIPCIVRRDLKEAETRVARATENLQRENLTPYEEAVAFQEALDVKGMSQVKLAEQLGISAGTVSNRLAYLRLPEPVARRLAAGEYPQTHVKELLAWLTEPEDVWATVASTVKDDAPPLDEFQAKIWAALVKHGHACEEHMFYGGHGVQSHPDFKATLKVFRRATIKVNSYYAKAYVYPAAAYKAEVERLTREWRAMEAAEAEKDPNRLAALIRERINAKTNEIMKHKIRRIQEKKMQAGIGTQPLLKMLAHRAIRHLIESLPSDGDGHDDLEAFAREYGLDAYVETWLTAEWWQRRNRPELEIELSDQISKLDPDKAMQAIARLSFLASATISSVELGFWLDEDFAEIQAKAEAEARVAVDPDGLLARIEDARSAAKASPGEDDDDA
jgi:ParB/RepB/Spo0J family partition protein